MNFLSEELGSYTFRIVHASQSEIPEDTPCIRREGVVVQNDTVVGGFHFDFTLGAFDNYGIFDSITEG